MGYKEWRYCCLNPEEWRFMLDARRVVLKVVIVFSNLIAAINNISSPANIAGSTMLSWLLLFALTWASEFSNDRSVYMQSRTELLNKSRKWNFWIRYMILAVSMVGGLYILVTGIFWIFYNNPPVILNSTAVTVALFVVAVTKAAGTLKDIHLVSGVYLPVGKPSSWKAHLPPDARN